MEVLFNLSLNFALYALEGPVCLTGRFLSLHPALVVKAHFVV
jgi:hypothetical protein